MPNKICLEGLSDAMTPLELAAFVGDLTGRGVHITVIDADLEPPLSSLEAAPPEPA